MSIIRIWTHARQGADYWQAIPMTDALLTVDSRDHMDIVYNALGLALSFLVESHTRQSRSPQPGDL
jgi:hypothetical protein